MGEDFKAIQAEWERKLKEIDPNLLTPDEEERGVHYGAEESKDMEQFWLDPIDQAIAEQLQTEGPEHVFIGSPTSSEAVLASVMKIYDELSTASEEFDDIKLIVHTSCVTSDDCIIVAQRGEQKYHMSTRLIEDYDRTELIGRLENIYKLEVVVKDE